MKKIKRILVVTALLLLVSTINFSCEKLDLNPSDGTGTLTLTNSSHNTVQRIMINGVNYGSLDPGDKKSIKLVPGTYTWQLVGISGGNGCSAAVVTIVKDKNQGFSCGG